MVPSRASVISRGVAGAVAPSLLPSVAMGTPQPASSSAVTQTRRSSLRLQPSNPVEREVSTDPRGVVWREGSLGDRASSKLTLDDELFDILYAFGESENILGKNKDDEDEENKPVTRQDLLNKIRQKKEVIGKLRMQPWSMGRKRRTLKLAQKYLEQHESKISKTHLYKEELKKALRLLKRSFDNFKTYLIPWEGKIKRIESHFGSVVSSYFTFLRWLIFVNLIVTLIVVCFVVVPEALADAAADPWRKNRTMSRKEISPHERQHADKLAVVWHFDGYLRYSPIFYGYYSNDEFVGRNVKYALPLAYFIVTLFIFGYSFFAILRKMAQNARMSKLSGSKADQYIFNWRVFTGWDYTIGNQDTASNTVMAVVIKLRESIAECRVGARNRMRCVQLLLRILANLIIFSMLAFSIYCIVIAVNRSKTILEEEGDLFTKNQVPSVVATITHVFPMIFDLVGKMERYHPRTALRAHLGRVLILYFVNYVTLIVALFDKLDTELEKKREYSQIHHRGKRQMGGMPWSPSEPRPPPFASLQFNNRSEFAAYLEQITTQKYHQTNRVPVRGDRRTTRHLQTTPYTVQPQFGPVNIHHPNAVRHNASNSKTFVATRVGPDPLPFFTPPPRTFPPFNPGKVKQQYGGPDFPTTIPPTKYPKQQGRPTPSWKSPGGAGAGSPLDRRTPGTTSGTTKKPNARKRPNEDVEPMDDSNRKNKKLKADEDDEYSAEFLIDRPARATTTTEKPLAITPDRVDIEELPAPRNEDIISIEPSPEIKVRKGDVAERRLLKDGENLGDKLCWETMIGQEIVKLVTMDLIVTILSILLIDFVRGLWIKYCSSWWCWDIETTFPEYGEFKVAENVLHIINNQGMIWLGLFFAPLLPFLNNIKLIIVLYLRGWACMTCNVPAREIFRASRSSNFYLTILLLWLLMCTLPVGYVIGSRKPSTNCGPFAGRDGFYTVVTDLIQSKVDATILGYAKHIASPGVVIPIIIFLVLIIYFLTSLVTGLRAANTDLQQQLVHERTEEKKKIFELAGGGAKKKQPEVNRDKDKKRPQMPQHLTEIEQKRRQPWRQHNGKDYDDSLVVSDSESDTEVEDLPESQEPSTRPLPSAIPSSTAETLPAMSQFHPSLGSLAEHSSETTPPKDRPDVIPRSHSHSHSVERSRPWRESPSNTSFDVHSNVVEVATPEEIRSLIKPLMDGRFSTTSSILKGFPKDIASPPTFVIAGGSRRSSKRSSYISIYEFTNEETGMPVMIQAGSGKLARREEPPRVPTHRPLQPTLEEETKRDSAEVTPQSPPEKQLSQPIPTKETPSETEISTNGTSPSNKFDPKNTAPEFQPWPSIDEVKERRRQLQMRSPLPINRPQYPRPASRSPEKVHSPRTMSKSMADPEQSADSQDEMRRSASPTRRFRISVSPTRRVESDSESVGHSRRRYVIKQERMLDSASTSTATIPTKQGSGKSADLESGVGDQSKQQQQFPPIRAPLANIEDDSPRSPHS
ncbi:unnamed protein product, partial [Mesorhabditis belari]|uniref:TMC domain-containing protein n=1 Tax=Mesorhabditis belari TaxID=2138241 RepID=A0AAF3FL08_9BILA